MEFKYYLSISYISLDLFPGFYQNIRITKNSSKELQDHTN